MGMMMYGDTLQAKVNKLLVDTERVNEYIDNIIFPNKGTFA